MSSRLSQVPLWGPTAPWASVCHRLGTGSSCQTGSSQSREPPRTYGKPQRPFTALLTVTLEQKSTAHGIPFLQSKSEALSVQRILCRVLSNSITQTMSHARTLLLPHQNR